MSESYTLNGDTWIWASGNRRLGQTFQVLQAHTLRFIDLELRNLTFSPVPGVFLYKAGPDNAPIGAFLSRDIGSSFCTLCTTTIQRVRFSMQSYNLTPGITYCICLIPIKSLGVGFPGWLYDKGDASYPRGIRISSDDNGITWQSHPGDDHIFVEFGDPPTPTPSPTPPLKNFLIPSLQYIQGDDSFRIISASSIPLHSTLYWTTKKPWVHKVKGNRRGVLDLFFSYFCFVSWIPVEQNEPGDTLYHTFDLPNWPFCQTRYFVIAGIVDGKGNYWEPWGDALTQYHNWVQGWGAHPIQYSLAEGKISLYNPDIPISGIRYTIGHDVLPLISSDNAPLCFNAYSPSHIIDKPNDWIAYHLETTHQVEQCHLEFVVDRGSSWPNPGSLPYFALDTGIFWYRSGPKLINILEHWKTTRRTLGKSDDPTGWDCFFAMIVLESDDPSSLISVTNDYLDLFYPQMADSYPELPLPLVSPHENPLFSQSPSVSPIFKKHNSYIPPTPISIRVQSNTDDCLKTYLYGAWFFQIDPLSVIVGTAGAHATGYGSGMRFLNVPIPKNSVIHEAYITFNAIYSTIVPNVKSIFHGQLSPNPITFSSLADYDSRPRTIASIFFDDIPCWYIDQDYDSPDLTTIIQEIINQPAWAPGNSIVIFWDDHDMRTQNHRIVRRLGKSHEEDPSNSPQLNIDYFPP